MSVKLLTEHYLEFLSLIGGYTSSSASTLVKMPHCWKSHVAAQFWLLLWNILINWTKIMIGSVIFHLFHRNSKKKMHPMENITGFLEGNHVLKWYFCHLGDNLMFFYCNYIWNIAARECLLLTNCLLCAKSMRITIWTAMRENPSSGTQTIAILSA